MPTLQLVIDSTGAVLGAKVFEGSTLKVSASATKAAASTGALDARMKSLGITSKTTSRLLGVGGLLGAFTAFAALSKTTKVVSEFESALVDLKGITGATTAELQQFELVAREIGANTAASASEAASGLTALSRAGFEVGESISAIRPVLNLGISQNLELGQSAEFVAAAVRGFRLEAQQAGEVANILANQANSSATDVTLLSNALSFTAATASLSGSDMAETAAAIGVLSDNAIKGSRAGTNLNQIFLKLAKPTSEARRLLQKLGVTLDDVNPEKVGLVPALQRLEPVLQSNAAAATLFGARNAAAARILAVNTDAIREQTDENRELGDIIGDLAEDKLVTLEGKFKILKSAAAELSLDIGEAGLAGSMKALVEIGTGTIQNLSLLVETMDRAKVAGVGLADVVSLGLVPALRFLNQESEAADERIKQRLQLAADQNNSIRQRLEGAEQFAANLRKQIEDAPESNPGLVAMLARTEAKIADLKAQGAKETVLSIREQLEDDPNNEGLKGALENARAETERLNKAAEKKGLELVKEGLADADVVADQFGISLERVEMALKSIAGGGGGGQGSGFAGLFAGINFAAFEQQLKAVEEQEASLQKLATAGARQRAEDSQTAFESLNERLEGLRQEAEFLQLGGAEVRKRSELQELLNLAQAAGIPITEELAGQYAKMIDENERTAEAVARWNEVGDAVGRGLGDAFKAVLTDSENLKDRLQGIFQAVIDQLLEVLVIQRLVGSASEGTGLAGFISNLGSKSANGNVFSQGNVVAFANGGLINGPTTFPMAGGRTGLAGEAGPEAIFPLTRENGKLGLRASGGGGGTVVNVKQVIQTPDPDAFRASQRQQVAGARRAFQSTGRR